MRPPSPKVARTLVEAKRLVKDVSRGNRPPYRDARAAIRSAGHHYPFTQGLSLFSGRGLQSVPMTQQVFV
jgi:hypothetical protein